jgi:hypothetical protein
MFASTILSGQEPDFHVYQTGRFVKLQGKRSAIEVNKRGVISYWAIDHVSYPSEIRDAMILNNGLVHFWVSTDGDLFDLHIISQRSQSSYFIERAKFLEESEYGKLR